MSGPSAMAASAPSLPPCTVCFRPAPRRCARCSAPYCSRDCQRADWTRGKHREVCGPRANVFGCAVVTHGGVPTEGEEAVRRIQENAKRLATVGVERLTVDEKYPPLRRAPLHGSLPSEYYVRVVLAGTPLLNRLVEAAVGGDLPVDCQTSLRLLAGNLDSSDGHIVVPFGACDSSVLPPWMRYIGGSTPKLRGGLSDRDFGPVRGQWVAVPTDDPGPETVAVGVRAGRIVSETLEEWIAHVDGAVRARVEELCAMPSPHNSLGALCGIYLKMGGTIKLLTSEEIADVVPLS